jgi:triacylglycerol lipase
LLAALGVVIAIGLTAAPGGAGAAASKPLPVPYDFLLSAIASGANFTGNPPGANDFSCKPSAAHPEPVILTHGILGDRVTNWQTYAPLLKNNGYCVFAITYGQSPLLPAPLNEAFGGLGKIEDSAQQLKVLVDQVLAATGAHQVDILGHSEGTVMPDYYAKFLGGAQYIDKYVSLAPLWHATAGGGLASLETLGALEGQPALGAMLTDLVAPALSELTGDSPFFAKLRSGGTTKVPGITYTNITTKFDELVTPYTSGFETGETNLVVQDFCKLDFTEHFEMAADPVAAALVLNALDPAHPRPVPCRVVLPFIGTGV